MQSYHSEQKKEEIRNAADITQVIGEHVQLKRAGANFTGLCPFHSEKTPSFTVFPQTQTFKCFGCGESGDVFAFLMKQQHLSFPEAMRELAARFGVELPSPQPTAAEQRIALLHQINAEAARLFHEHLTKSPQAESARQYLAQRKVPQEAVANWQLGFAPDGWDFLSSRLLKQFPADAVEQVGLIVRRQRGKGLYDRFRRRIMFPIMDTGSTVCGFSGRVLDDAEPKYLNSPESPIYHKSSILFGLHQHRQAIRQSSRAVIVEGNFDLLMLAAHGISNTVAPLGTALTAEQVRKLHGYCKEAVLLFDGDEAGMKAAKRAVPLFLAQGMEGKAALLPAGYDPDSFIRAQGAAAGQELISKAQPLPEFVFDELVKKHGSTLAGKNRIMAELAELVKLSPDRAQKELAAAHWAGQLGISPELLLPESATAATIRIMSDEEMSSESLTLRIPENILNPGGLISKCMAEMRSSGLPDIPQYNFPVVLAAIARAISGKITAAGYWPNLYLLKVGPTSSGKSSSDRFMRKRLDGKLNGFYGPSDFASGPALLRALSQQPCALIVLDEATRMFRRYRGGPDPILDGKKDVLMELHSNTGMIYRKSYADAKNNIEILNPCVSVTGNATPVIFDSIRQEDFETGMMQRFDFFCYDGNILNREFLCDEEGKDSISAFINELYSCQTGGNMNNTSEIGFVADAEKAAKEWSKQITAEANQSDEGGARGIVSRQFEASIKYAMIHHASANGPEKLAAPLSADSLQWGIETAKMLAEWKLNVLPKKLTSGDFHRDCELFKDAIRAAMKVTRKDRAGKTKLPTFAFLSNRRPALKNWDKRYSSSIIEALNERGEIVLDESGQSTAYYLPFGSPD
jgi:DNA primase